jgi:epoxyqueuosine reductase
MDATDAARTRQEELRRRLGAIGFDEVRFASLRELGGERLNAWLAAGYHADMQWMERTAERRLKPELVQAEARSVIMLGVSYADAGHGTQREGPEVGTGRATWARYALNEDYHDTMKAGLIAAGQVLAELYGATREDFRAYVDTGPVLERGWAAKAGLGFIGKNAMLISRRHGNWLFLATILTRQEFLPDAPVRRQASDFADVGLLCGKCTRCLDACPTHAFAAPGVVDARRCVSYQTIENKGIIPRELRTGIGNRIYGCDVCLEVCPWNRFAQAGRAVLLVARRELAGLTVREILALTPGRFAEVFRKTPIKRVKLGGLLRNACVVAGNSGDVSLIEPLVALASGHELPLVRAHAVWAVRKLGGETALARARATETDAEVLAEYAAVTL